MRLRAGRLLVGAAAWLAIGASAFFLSRSESQIAQVRTAVRSFDQLSRDTIDALADVRAAQPAYLASGQGVAFWVAKVATTGDTVRAGLATLRQTARSQSARAALASAAASVQQFADADRRALDYINASQPLMAGDVIFTEGTQVGAAIARDLEQARLLERQNADAGEASIRRSEIAAASGAAVVTVLLVALLVPVRARSADESATDARDADGEIVAHATATPRTIETPVEIEREEPQPRPMAVPRADVDALRLTLDAGEVDIPLYAAETPRRVVLQPPPPDPTLKLAADLAIEFGRARDVKDLQQLLSRAATLMDASGLVVWMASVSGNELRPLLTHGYSLQIVARLAAVPRAANNAAAAAFRSGRLQIVRSSAGASGAIVAPILTAGGCVGALSAEFRSGEASDRVQALASLIAAQLAGILLSTPGEEPETKAAAV